MSDVPELKQDAVTTVREFLTALELGAVNEALELLDPGIVWQNTFLPDLRGIDHVGGLLRGIERRHLRFRADMHHIAREFPERLTDEGDVVLTERTDHVRLGPVEISFVVCGTFELVDGRITVWNDHFAWEDVLRGAVAGVWNAVRR
ncbi:limonene-1,2-epoxide hydrolase family protein [Nocardia stercoris]|uniref:Epoxide hydrolase n=1 Tax=Nocardia stercoris TaxID=2483361 RepID=A0A3M2LG78_9NOCA|nr:limonene-1,2-epoxide hydrolase family protein [Nocardia stercoris]RMI34955.1 epoxide hydrolase [Nocardia stercoris]